MTISIQGTPQAVSGLNPNITLPTHASGDMLLIAAARPSNTASLVPSAGGTVPTWNTILTGGANTWSLISAYAIATAANHTAGVWSGAQNAVSIAFRSTSGGLVLGVNDQLNGVNVAAINFPAISGTDGASGTSYGLRFASRNTAASGVDQNNPVMNGVNWSGNVSSLATTNAFLSIKTFSRVSGPILSGTISTAGTGGDFRSQTIEIMEAPLSGAVANGNKGRGVLMAAAHQNMGGNVSVGGFF